MLCKQGLKKGPYPFATSFKGSYFFKALPQGLLSLFTCLFQGSPSLSHGFILRAPILFERGFLGERSAVGKCCIVLYCNYAIVLGKIMISIYRNPNFFEGRCRSPKSRRIGIIQPLLRCCGYLEGPVLSFQRYS